MMLLTIMKELDVTKSVKKAVCTLKKYRMYMLSVDDKHLPKVTPIYLLTLPSNTNRSHSSNESVIEFVDREREGTMHDSHMEAD